jgi:mRNA interferase RelE/StbE
MASYKLAFCKSVARDLRGIPKPDLQKIPAAIESLAEQPRPAGSEKLSGQGRYRLRRGDYRIVCEVSDDDLRVVVAKVGHRRDVYRRA